MYLVGFGVVLVEVATEAHALPVAAAAFPVPIFVVRDLGLVVVCGVVPSDKNSITLHT